MAQAQRATLKRDPDAPAYKVLRNRLISARTAAGLTQEVLAGRLNRPQSFIAKIERGERSIDVVEFVALCRQMKLDVAAVIEDIASEL